MEYGYESDNSFGSIDYPDEPFENYLNLDPEIQELLNHFDINEDIYITEDAALEILSKYMYKSCTNDEIYYVELMLQQGILYTDYFMNFNKYKQVKLFEILVIECSIEMVELFFKHDLYCDPDLFVLEDLNTPFIEIVYKKHFHILELMLNKKLFGVLGEWIVANLWEENVKKRGEILKLLIIYMKIDEIKNSWLHEVVKKRFEDEMVPVLDDKFVFGIGDVISKYLV